MDQTLKKASFIGIAALCAAAFLFGALSLYEKGYRFNGIRISAPGTIILTNYPEGATLTIGEREVEVRAENGEVRIPLKADSQHLILSQPGYWPWDKEIAVASGKEMRFGAFLLRQSPEGTPVLERDPLRRPLDALFAKASLPSREKPIISADGKVELFVEGGNILTRWVSHEEAPQYYCIDGSCEEHTALSFDAELRDVAFYPGRNDIALLAIQNGIFALELDNRGTQNFQPAYRGSRPRFVFHEGVLYLKDGQAVLSLSL